MEHFELAPLSSVGRPNFFEDEVEIKLFPQVDVWTGTKGSKESDLFPSVLLILTNYRVMVITTQQSKEKRDYIGRGMWLKSVADVQDCASFMKRSKRVRLVFYQQKCNTEIGFRFNQGSKDEFLDLLQKAIGKKSWEVYDMRQAQKAVAKPTEQFSVVNAGVSGLIRRQEKTIQNVGNLTKDALSDMDALVKKAREVVDVVQRYAAYRQQEQTQELMSETSTQVAEVNELESIMEGLGMVSPVTRYSAGRLFRQQVALQVADLLLEQQRLQRLGGMITLTDLYCLVNRARGTELLSPDDLLAAARALEQLTSTHPAGALRLTEFPSGVKVVELVALGERSFVQRVTQLLASSREFVVNGVGASTVAAHCGVSLAVAKERLAQCEREGWLCRDEHISGVTFFTNVFADFVRVNNNTNTNANTNTNGVNGNTIASADIVNVAANGNDMADLVLAFEQQKI